MSTPTTQRRSPRIRTIVWGAILVGIAVFSILAIFAGPLGPAAVLWSIVGFGGLLVIAAVLAVIVRAARRGSRVAAATAAVPTAGIETFTEPAEAAKPTDKDQPIG
ncbi:MAG: hypothetical protein QOH44_1061 [Actinomycetota bacterium]|nr:hypothetical protein [Actinomycetota bacterium]